MKVYFYLFCLIIFVGCQNLNRLTSSEATCFWEGDNYYCDIEKHPVHREFRNKIQIAVRDGDMETIANMIDFPTSINIYDVEVLLKIGLIFFADYDYTFNDALKNACITEDYHHVECHHGRCFIGNGALIISDEDSAKVQIEELHPEFVSKDNFSPCKNRLKLIENQKRFRE